MLFGNTLFSQLVGDTSQTSLLADRPFDPGGHYSILNIMCFGFDLTIDTHGYRQVVSLCAVRAVMLLISVSFLLKQKSLDL